MGKDRFYKRIKLQKGEYYREKSGLFEFKWKDDAGIRRTVYAKTLPELREKEQDILVDRVNGIKYCGASTTINDCYDLLIASKDNCTESTMCSYKLPYERYVEPVFGKRKIKDVTVSDVSCFYKSLRTERSLSDGSIRIVHKVLKQVFDLAIEDCILSKNPCPKALVRVVGHETSKKRSAKYLAEQVKALTFEEQKEFVDYLQRSDRFNMYYPLFVIALETGMRMGELIGLRWVDVDLSKGEIDVNHTLESYPLGKGKGLRKFVNLTKTGRDRKIPMTSKAKQAFLQQKAYLEQAGIKSISIVEGYDNQLFSDFVFVNSMGKVFTYNNTNSKLYKIVKEHNDEVLREGGEGIMLPHIHNHMLRHSFATRMREAGCDIKATAEIMGHQDMIRMTLGVYTNTGDDFNRKAMSGFEDYYS